MGRLIDKTSRHWDELRNPTEFRALFRYRKGETVVVCSLRQIGGRGAEVWMRAEEAGQALSSEKWAFAVLDECLSFLHDEEDRLGRLGWRQESA